jgi:hypothetical protein
MPLFGVAFSVAMPVAALFVRGFPAGGGCAQVRRSSRLASGPQSAARRAGWSRFIVSTAHFCSEVVTGSHPPRVNHIGTGTFVRCSQPRDARLSNPANSKRIIARSCQRRVHQAEPVARAAAWRIPRHASELPPIPAAHTAPQGQEGAEDLSLVPGVWSPLRAELQPPQRPTAIGLWPGQGVTIRRAVASCRHLAVMRSANRWAAAAVCSGVLTRAAARWRPFHHRASSHQERDNDCYGSEVSGIYNRRIHRVPAGVN